jgi:hypothetical protein
MAAEGFYTVICNGVCREIPVDEDPPEGCTIGVCVVERRWSWIVWLILLLLLVAGAIAKSK